MKLSANRMRKFREEQAKRMRVYREKVKHAGRRRVEIRLPVAILEKLDATCNSEKLSRSRYIEVLLDDDFYGYEYDK